MSCNFIADKRTPTTSYPAGQKIFLPIAIVVGVLILFILTVFATVFSLRRLNSNARTRSLDTEENIGFVNLAYQQPRNLPDDKPQMKVKIENELNALDSPNSKNEPLRNCPPTAFSKYIKKMEATSTCTVGEIFGQGCSNWERVPNECEERVELAEKECFSDSRPGRVRPFRMYKDNRMITVKLTYLEEGWNFHNTDDAQICKSEKAGCGFRSTEACDFLVKPEDGLDFNGFSCRVKFQQKDDDEEHSFYLNPGFTTLRQQSIRRRSAKGGQTDPATGTLQYEDSVDWDNYVSSLGREPVTDELIYQISPDVGRDWKNLLRIMSLKEKVIENLSEDHKYDKITEQCIQGLLKWKELDPQLATIKNLAIALHHTNCFDALQTLQKQQRAKHQ
ncbi:uncharacterized protein LOC110060594 isoform X1 [Orbicella faveolata]|uniref:uncharacterized protein LOC110060594 isoform X1 n=1 Tax=Orbicella faveolata TaxID=48498 RepID=UPI0009E526E3|nr:uncharacterized protein LOC110060594 isoform X1 [Orbicella faveolata]